MQVLKPHLVNCPLLIGFKTDTTTDWIQNTLFTMSLAHYHNKLSLSLALPGNTKNHTLSHTYIKSIIILRIITKLINVPCYYWLRKSPPMLCIDRYLPVSDTGTLGQTEDTFVGGSGGNRGGIGSRKWHFLHFEGTFELNLKDSNHIYSVKCYHFKKI